MSRRVDLAVQTPREDIVIRLSGSKDLSPFSKSSQGLHRVLVERNRPATSLSFTAVNPKHLLEQIDVFPLQALQFNSTTSRRGSQDGSAVSHRPTGTPASRFKQHRFLVHLECSTDIGSLWALRNVVSHHRPQLGLLQHATQHRHFHVDRASRDSFLDAGLLIAGNRLGLDRPTAPAVSTAPEGRMGELSRFTDGSLESTPAYDRTFGGAV